MNDQIITHQECSFCDECFIIPNNTKRICTSISMKIWGKERDGWGKNGLDVDGVKMGSMEWKICCQFSMVHVLDILCMLHIFSFLSHGRHKHIVPEVLLRIKFSYCLEGKRYVVVWQILSKFNHHAGWFQLKQFFSLYNIGTFTDRLTWTCILYCEYVRF